MNDKKHVEFRYYDIPQGDILLALTGKGWNKEYGEGKDKLHFHNYFEVGHCYAGEGEMILGERELLFYPGCISLIPRRELHTTNTFGKKAGWEWMYFDIYEVLKKLYPDDEILRDNIAHEIEREGRLLTPDKNIQKLTFFVQSIFSEMQDKEYMSKILAKDLARSCGMSESYFRKVFEKYMNMKPMEYVNFFRIQKGCALLRETDLSIAMVSDKVGYESVSTFIRNFKRVIGRTPNSWKSDEEYAKNKFMNYNITALQGWLE